MDKCGTCDDDAANDCKEDCAGGWGGKKVRTNAIESVDVFHTGIDYAFVAVIAEEPKQGLPRHHEVPRTLCRAPTCI